MDTRGKTAVHKGQFMLKELFLLYMGSSQMLLPMDDFGPQQFDGLSVEDRARRAPGPRVSGSPAARSFLDDRQVNRGQPEDGLKG